MKKLLVAVLACVFCFSAVAQKTISLTFVGADASKRYVKLDKIVVTGMNRGWSDTLIYPDTVLTLINATGIQDNENLVASLNHNVPNPFEGTTDVALTVPEKQQVRMAIYDVNGRAIISQNEVLNAGSYALHISLAIPQTYILNVKMNNFNASVKMVNIGHAGDNKIECKGMNAVSFKSGTLESVNRFALEDKLKVVGYTTRGEGLYTAVQEINPKSSQKVTLTFNGFPTPSVPTMNTYPAFHISDTSFYTGGFVEKNGAGVVTQCGICWSTKPNPTIDSSLHTTQTLRDAEFTTFISNLEPNTTYYFRCYGINKFGIAYGEEYSLKTNEKGAVAPACQGVTTVKDYDNNVYHTIQIGNQCWLKENMHVRHFPDGTPIAPATFDIESYSKPYYYYPQGNEEYEEVYGLLYNFAAAAKGQYSNNTQGICPNGWHVVTEQEWTDMIAYVSNRSDYNYQNDYCKDTGLDFTPSGYIYDHSFYTHGFSLMIWTATSYSDESAWIRMFLPQFSQINKYAMRKCSAMTVRCIKD